MVRFHQASRVCEVALGMGVFLCVSTAAHAQGPRAGSATSTGITIGGTQPATPKFERCIDVEIGGDRSLGCLNQNLKREVDRVNPSLNLPPIDARSPDIRVGNVNDAAVRQQYGSNFGRSVYPYRPPVGVYTAPRR